MKDYVIKIVGESGVQMDQWHAVGNNAAEALENAIDEGWPLPAGQLLRAVVINQRGLGIEFRIGLNF